MTVEAIMAAIQDLPPDERGSLRRWLDGFGDDDWDARMAADFSPGGRGMELVERIRRDASKSATPFAEGWIEARKATKPPNA